MPALSINGCTIHFQERGSGPTVVLTPGGRWGAYVQEVVARRMSARCRVITWDRRNCDGPSDICVQGELSESEIWAEDLAELIIQLGLAPCFIGEYAGCRVTPSLCLRHPDLVKGLLLGWPSGGSVPAQRLTRNFYRQYIDAAHRGGMTAVTETDHFATSISQNPGNRDRLMAMGTQDFIATMSHWETYFTQSGHLPTAGCPATEEQWASIQTPTIVVPGCDPIHPTEAGQRIARIMPNCEYHVPVVTLDEWDRVFGHNPYPVTSKLQGERIAPVWLDFVNRMESRRHTLNESDAP